MDRTSILGDTIDYMKELLEKINSLQQEIEGSSNITGIFKNVKPNEVLVRNSPKVRTLLALLSKILKIEVKHEIVSKILNVVIPRVAFAV